MEQDGGAEPSARIAAAGQPARPRNFITLAQPRPGAARQQNEYIETPLRPQLPSQGDKLAESRLKGVPAGSGEAARLPITSQPTLSEEKDSGSEASEHAESIICRQCRRCKCEACRSPRDLPSKWICNDKCLCSPRNVVDYCSCVCCVKGLFYHWAKDYESDNAVSCADQPCSCSPHERLLRWVCLGLLALPLPCLCCYWPLRGCTKLCERCYSECSGRGCRCSAPHRTPQLPEKRLLDSNSDC